MCVISVKLQIIIKSDFLIPKLIRFPRLSRADHVNNLLHYLRRRGRLRYSELLFELVSKFLMPDHGFLSVYPILLHPDLTDCLRELFTINLDSLLLPFGIRVHELVGVQNLDAMILLGID